VSSAAALLCVVTAACSNRSNGGYISSRASRWAGGQAGRRALAGHDEQPVWPSGPAACPPDRLQIIAPPLSSRASYIYIYIHTYIHTYIYVWACECGSGYDCVGVGVYGCKVMFIFSEISATTN
jgi:hypothetical protein